jgi:hypothetical protein
MNTLQIHNALKRKYQGDVEKSAVIPTSKQIGNQKKLVLNIDDAIKSTSDLKEYLVTLDGFIANSRGMLKNIKAVYECQGSHGLYLSADAIHKLLFNGSMDRFLYF